MCLSGFVRFYKEIVAFYFYVVIENIHKNRVGKVLPYQFEPEAGANVSNISDENSEQESDSLCLTDHELERVNSSRLQSSNSLGPVYEFVCVSFRTGNLNCFRVK